MAPSPTSGYPVRENRAKLDACEGTVRRYPLICLLLAGVASPALADDLTVTSILTSPVTTSHANNGTAGNISIQTGGGISTTAAGATVTIDSANTVESVGIIQNAFANGGAIGVHILSGSASTFIADATSASIINV